MLDRRTFLASAGLGLAGSSLLLADEPSPPKRLAVITTEWRYHSHAWHMAERFLVGYPREGRWHRPPLKVVAAYVDQKPEKDLSRSRAAEFGFRLSPTIADAVKADGKLVDAVLIIGEHGDYPINEFGQKKYPRYEFFKAVTDVFRKEGKTAPVFNDKHLSWKWDFAKEMVDISRELKFPFLAGSSLPVTWRMPAIDMPYGAEVEEMMCVAMGPTDIYDFHALETMQCMAERRKGGETGVAWIEALRGEAVWKAMAAADWKSGGWDKRLFEACLSRSQTLAQPESFSHRYPTDEQIKTFVKDPIAYRFEYRDGLKATMFLLNGLVGDFTFAARIKGEAEPLSTLFYLPPNPNVTYSASLMSKAEETFTAGKAPYPVERTLLTSGLVEAALQSLTKKQRLETPHLEVRYEAPRESQFVRR